MIKIKIGEIFLSRLVCTFRGGPVSARARQIRDGRIAADPHVRLEGPAVQLIPEMLAQRRLANLKLSSYLGLGDTKGRSTLHKRALGIGRHIFGWHFKFPIAQPRDARALYEKWRMSVRVANGR